MNRPVEKSLHMGGMPLAMPQNRLNSRLQTYGMQKTEKKEVSTERKSLRD